jgi:hypothetical protein
MAVFGKLSQKRNDLRTEPGSLKRRDRENQLRVQAKASYPIRKESSRTA